MTCDAWTGPSGQPVVGMSIGDQLFKASETIGESHTSVYMAQVLETALLEAQVELNCTVVSLVTDGASNMVAARNLLQTKFPKVSLKGC